VLANSLPKSGSSVLAETVEMLGYKNHIPSQGTPKAFNYKVAKDALHNRRDTKDTERKVAVSPFAPWYVEQETFRHWLDAVLPGHYIFGHLPRTSALSSLIADLNYRHVVIIRDPRAVLASLIFEEGIIPRFLIPDLEPMSLTQRLNFMSEGGYAPKADATLGSFADIYRSMLAWRNDKNCLAVRFEELVGEHGREPQRRAIKTMGSYLDVQFDEDIFVKINSPDASWAQRFRTDQLDKWKNSMDEEHIEHITEYCQTICREAGYCET
jgi:hypothetical protein